MSKGVIYRPTSQELQYIIENCDSMPRKTIATNLNISVNVVTYAIRKHHLSKRREWTQEEDKILDDNLSKEMLRKISVSLGRTACAVMQRYYMLKRNSKRNGQQKVLCSR